MVNYDIQVMRCKKTILSHYRRVRSWRKVGESFTPPIPARTVYRFAKTNYIPKDPKLCKALGIPVLAQAMACPSCGVVHVSKRCPHRRRYRRWSDMPPQLLRWALDHREVVQ
jgi:hypothetical protein